VEEEDVGCDAVSTFPNLQYCVPGRFCFLLHVVCVLCVVL
jgi:hypothetical protein